MHLIPEAALHRNHPCEACPRGNGEQGSTASYYAAPRIHHRPKDGFLLAGRNDGAGGPLVGCPAYERVACVTFGPGLRPSMLEFGRLQGVA